MMPHSTASSPPSLLPFLALLLPLSLSLPCTSSVYLHEANEALQAAAMDAQERETLFLVMEAMSSDRDWRSSSPDPCSPGSSWPGIECKPGKDNLLHVTRLDFGVAPNPTCRRDATFPSIVFDLPHLQSLFFLSCFKTTRTTLSMPSAGAARPPLEQLSVKSNPSLVGSIPSALFSSLTSLQVLTLSQNQLAGGIPDGLSLLTSLIHLDLSYNTLTGGIPSGIGELGNLVGLDLSYNSLSGPIPCSIGRLSLLQKLDLSSNALNGSIPGSVQGLAFLAFLALSNNRLNGELPPGIARLQNLQYLIMDDNPVFIQLPALLGRLSKLEELRLANSGYSGAIPATFVNLANLTTLSLENNKLSGEIPTGLSELTRIYHLNLSRNLLSGVVPFNAGFLRRLGRNLDLSGNSGLCLGGSTGLTSVDVGVGICGGGKSAAGGGSASIGWKGFRSSGGAPCLLCRFYYHFLAYFSPLLFLVFFCY